MGLPLFWVGTVGVTVAAVAWTRHRKRTHVRGTVLDVVTADDAVALVRAIDRGGGTDDVADRLARLYETFPPDERLMRRLSILQQAHQGQNGIHDFSITLVYVVATEAIASQSVGGHPHDEGDEHTPEVIEDLQGVHRCRSEPCLVVGVGPLDDGGHVVGDAVGHRVVDARELVHREDGCHTGYGQQHVRISRIPHRNCDAQKETRES